MKIIREKKEVIDAKDNINAKNTIITRFVAR
jgi:hypothetical protein